MNKKSFTKRVMALALSLIMVLGLMPMTVFADGEYNFYCEGNNSTIRWYVTDENEAEIIITEIGTTEDSYKDIKLSLYFNDGWYFEKWITKFTGSRNVPDWFDEKDIIESNPSYGGRYLFFNVYRSAPFVNDSGTRSDGSIYLKVMRYPFYGNMRVDAVLRPILTVNAGDGVSYKISTSNPLSSGLASNQVAVIYEGNATINYTVDSKYVITKIDANYATNFADNGSKVTVSTIKKPATININSRLKQQNINFHANGGSGTMTAQTFEHSVAQALTANTFTRTGYTFAGWNTKVDGSGAGYSDQQSVTFTPANDGDSITLYAQWEEEPVIPSDYTVSFDANGGDAIAPITVTHGETYGRLPSSAVTGLSGGDSNWYLVDESGSVTDTKITGSSVVSQTRDHTLFVKRKVLAPTVSIALTVPGGLSDKDQYYIPGNSQRVLTATVSNMNTEILDYSYQWYKDGTPIDGAASNVLTLDGNVSDSGTYKVEVTATLKDGTNIVVTSDTATASKEQKVTILHAANTLYYNANGGEGGPSSNYTGGTSITVQPNEPTRNGYVFSGWNTKADGTGESYVGGENYTFAEDNGNGGCKVTLYAQWIKSYGVYVGGTLIIETNKNDVFGDGKVSYNAETGTLTLNNYTYAGNGYQYDSFYDSEDEETELYSAAIYSENSITIDLKGNNSLQNTFTDFTKHQYGDGIVVKGDLTLTGNGNMNISAAYGVYIDEKVTVDGVTLNIQATDDGIAANDVNIKNRANVIIQATDNGIYVREGDAIIETGSSVVINANIDGIYAHKDVLITDSSVTIDADEDGIYSYDGSVVIDSTKTNVSANGPWLEGTKVSITAGEDYGIFAYKGLTVDEKLTVSVPENGSVGELAESDYTYGTVIADGAAAKEIVIEPLGYKVTVTGLANGMEVLVPANQSMNDAYCEMYGVADFSEILDTQKDGYIFGGWYTDEACTEGNEFSFDAPVNANVTIYAKWVFDVPVGEIKVKNNLWTAFLDTITFGQFFKESQDVTISATALGSDINSIEYYIANAEMTLDEVKAISAWQGYNGTFKINPDNRYVIYAKITNNAGNVTYISSDGLVLDATAPALIGIENNGVYYGDKVFKAIDDNFLKIEIDSVDVTDTTQGDDEYRIIADNAEHTVTVTDKAGNVIEYKVTVYKNYTVTYKADGVTVDTQTVGHGKDATLPAVPAKDGYTGKWDHDGKNITSDIVINAVYTEKPASVPSDPQSPQTGDNSNMMLWIALLFISGGALITLTVYDRKKRMESKS